MGPGDYFFTKEERKSQMPNYQVAWNATTKTATVQADGDAPPAGSVRIGGFKHDDDEDGLGASDVSENHVFYHHVRDALYHQGVENMQLVSIEQDTTYVAVTGLISTPATVTLAPAATQQITNTISPGGASNNAVTYSTSNATKATVSSTGLITAVAAGSATITVTTVDGGFTDTVVVTIS